MTIVSKSKGLIYAPNGEISALAAKEEANIDLTLYRQDKFLIKYQLDITSMNFALTDDAEVYFLIPQNTYQYDVCYIPAAINSSLNPMVTSSNSPVQILGNISLKQPVIALNLMKVDKKTYVILICPSKLCIIDLFDKFKEVNERIDIMSIRTFIDDKMTLLYSKNDIHNRVICDTHRRGIFFKNDSTIYFFDLISFKSDIYYQNNAPIDRFSVGFHEFAIIVSDTSPKSINIVNVNQKKLIKSIDFSEIDKRHLLAFYFNTLTNCIVFISSAVSLKGDPDRPTDICSILIRMQSQPDCLKLQVLDLKNYHLVVSEEINTNPHKEFTFFVSNSGKVRIDNSDVVIEYNMAHGLQNNPKYYLYSSEMLPPISGLEIVAWAHEVIDALLSEHQQLTKPTHITAPNHWLATAGHYSPFCAGIDRCHIRRTGFLGTKLTLMDSIISIETRSRDAWVNFQSVSGGDYVSISQTLLSIVTAPWESYSLDEIIAALTNPDSQQLRPNPYHGELAQALLARMRGEDYPSIFVAQKTFLDTLLALCIVVEGSRNNLTFLTWLLLLDLIASNHTFGRHARAFDWGSAFRSGPSYVWNDAEHKDLGGKYPMAANSTGAGNLRNRADAIRQVRINNDEQIAQETYRIFQEKQHHYVLIREIKLILTWLRKYMSADPQFLKGCVSKHEVKQEIQGLFKRRLNSAYITPSPTNFLPENQSGYTHGQVLPRHYEKETHVILLAHKKDPNVSDGVTPRQPFKIETEQYYHRADYPCKLVAEYVLRGQTKDLTYPRLRLSLDKILTRTKRQTALVRHLSQNTQPPESIKPPIEIHCQETGQKIVLTTVVTEQIWRVLDDYIDWRNSYFNAKALLNRNEITGRLFFSYMCDYERYNDLTVACVNQLRWQPMDGNPTAMQIDANQIMKILDKLGQEPSYTRMIDAMQNVKEDYIDKFLRALHLCIDPIWEEGKHIWPSRDLAIPEDDNVEEEVNRLGMLYQLKPNKISHYIIGLLIAFIPSPYDIAHVLKELHNKFQMIDITIRSYLASRLNDLNKMPVKYSAVFNLENKKPCPCCYASDTDPFPAMPFNHDEVACFINKGDEENSLSTYHRVGSTCDKTASASAKYQFVMQAKMHSVACEQCWVLSTPQPVRQAKRMGREDELQVIAGKRPRLPNQDSSALSKEDVSLFTSESGSNLLPDASTSDSYFSWYTDEDIQAYLEAAILQAPFHGHENNQTYHVSKHITMPLEDDASIAGSSITSLPVTSPEPALFLLAPISTLQEHDSVVVGTTHVSGLPLTWGIDKNTRSLSKLEALLQNALDNGSREKFKVTLDRERAEGNSLARLNELMALHNDWPSLYNALHEELRKEQESKQDVVDELYPYFANKLNANAKLLFAYHQDRTHWLVGELILCKQTIVDQTRYQLTAYTHDPYGKGQMPESIAKTLHAALLRRLRAFDPTITDIPLERPVSPYTRRQMADDTVSCGPIVAEDIMKCLRNESLNITNPYPYGAASLRQAQKQTIKEQELTRPKAAVALSTENATVSRISPFTSALFPRGTNRVPDLLSPCESDNNQGLFRIT